MGTKRLYEVRASIISYVVAENATDAEEIFDNIAKIQPDLGDLEIEAKRARTCVWKNANICYPFTEDNGWPPDETKGDKTCAEWLAKGMTDR